MWKIRAGVVAIAGMFAIYFTDGYARVNCSAADEKPDHQSAHGVHTPAPCTCPYVELFPIGGGEFCYYAEYYPTCSEPEMTLLWGNLALAEYCGDEECIDASKRKNRQNEPKDRRDFKGLKATIDLQYQHALPGRDWTALPSVVPRFIKFTHPANTTPRYAKVFTYFLDLQSKHKNAALTNKIIHVAMELKAEQVPPKAETKDVSLDALYEPREDKECYAFRATTLTKSEKTQKAHLLLVTAPSAGKP
jgi:hypothetical protein